MIIREKEPLVTGASLEYTRRNEKGMKGKAATSFNIIYNIH